MIPDNSPIVFPPVPPDEFERKIAAWKERGPIVKQRHGYGRPEKRLPREKFIARVRAVEVGRFGRRDGK